MISQIVARIQNGHPSAFGELYDVSYDKVYRFIYHRIGNHEQSEDVVAETYMKALKHIHHFR